MILEALKFCISYAHRDHSKAFMKNYESDVGKQLEGVLCLDFLSLYRRIRRHIAKLGFVNYLSQYNVRW